jgi:cathepsin L
MKNSRLILATVAGATLAATALQSQPAVSGQIARPPVDYARREQNASAEIKKRLADARVEVQAHNLGYRVGYTTAMDRRRQDLLGAKEPPNMARIARTQNALAGKVVSVDRGARDAFAKARNIQLPESQAQCAATDTSLDWRKMGKVTPVRNQACGNCWDYAAVAAYESSYLIRNGRAVDLSEQDVLDCSGGGSCSGGWSWNAFDYMVNHGIGNQAAYPSDLPADPDSGTQSPCNASAETPYRAVTWGAVTQENIPGSDFNRMPTVQELKQALCTYGPLAVAAYATPRWSSYTGDVFHEHKSSTVAGPDGAIFQVDQNGTIYTVVSKGTPDDPRTGKACVANHVVLLIGWDDSLRAWLIKNSWGTGWGDACGYGNEGGYMWIAYGTDNIGYGAAWVQAKSNYYQLPKAFYDLNPIARPMPEAHTLPSIELTPAVVMKRAPGR